MAAAEMIDDKDVRDDGRARAPRAVVGSHRQEEEMFGRAFDGRILARIWRFVRPYRRQMAIAVAAVLIFTGTQVAIPLIIRFAIDHGMATGNSRVLTLSVMAFLVAILINYAASYVQETVEVARTLVARSFAGRLDANALLSEQGALRRSGLLPCDTDIDGTLASRPTQGSCTLDEAAAPFDRLTDQLGEFGNGSRMKYIANLLVTVHNLVTAEAHALGIASGMDPAVVQEVMEDGVGSSKIFEIRGPMMVADDYPPAARLDIILKDANLISEYATSVGAPTPLLEAALQVYREASAEGLGDLDAAALCRHLERIGGLVRP